MLETLPNPELTAALAALPARGFLPLEVDPTLDLVAEITRMKREKNAILLAHFYQDADIQDVADYIGDSLGLAQKAKDSSAELIVFAGVHFMAETAKILNPQAKVVLPDLKAGCSLADSAPAHLFAKFKERYPNHVVVSYINCSADLKTVTDIVCTSTNAVQIIESIPKDQPIIFAPDRNLGRYLMAKTGRDMVLWNGACMVHELFSARRIEALMQEHPSAHLIAHPECEEAVLRHAHHIGSTSALLSYTQKSDAQEFIVATEPGIIHQMLLKSPHKRFIPAPPDNHCACNDCPHMKRNTLEKIYLALKYELPEITMPPAVMDRARLPIERMLEVSRQAGLVG